MLTYSDVWRQAKLTDAAATNAYTGISSDLPGYMNGFYDKLWPLTRQVFSILSNGFYDLLSNSSIKQRFLRQALAANQPGIKHI